MLTQRAFLLGFVALCLYLVAVVNTLPGYFYVLTWLAVGLLVASLGLALTSLSGLEFEWRVLNSRGTSRPLAASPENLERENLGDAEASGDAMAQLEAEGWSGVPPLLEVTLRNRASLSKVGLVLELAGQIETSKSESPGSEVTRSENATAKDGRREAVVSFLVEALGAGAVAVAEVPLDGLPRGVYQLREARLIGSDVLGVFRLRRRIALEQLPAVIVAPPLVELAPRELRAAGQQQSGTRHAILHRGDEMRGLRPYASGDDLRHVHWKSSARVGELVVREWEQPGRAAALVVWMGAAPAPVSSQTGVVRGSRSANAACELALSLCGSLSLALLRSGSPVTLVCAGADIERAESALTDGAVLPVEFLDLLARARVAERVAPDALAPARHGRDLLGQSDVVILIAPFPRSEEELERLVPPRRAGREGTGRTVIVLLDASALIVSPAPRGWRRAEEQPQRFSAAEIAAQLRARGLESCVVAPSSLAEVPDALRAAVAQLL